MRRSSVGREGRKRDNCAYRESGGDLLGSHFDQPDIDYKFEQWRWANWRIWWCRARYGVSVKLGDVREAGEPNAKPAIAVMVSAPASHLIRYHYPSLLRHHNIEQDHSDSYVSMSTRKICNLR